jgi:hypothetical protein
MSVVISGSSGSSNNKTDHDTTKILLKVALSTIKQTNKLTDIVYDNKKAIPYPENRDRTNERLRSRIRLVVLESELFVRVEQYVYPWTAVSVS